MTTGTLSFRTTVSCRQKQKISVGDNWFVVIDTYNDEDGRGIQVITPKHPGRESQWSTPHWIGEKQPYELFPNVRLTCLAAGKRSSVRFRLDVPEGVPFTKHPPRSRRTPGAAPE